MTYLDDQALGYERIRRRFEPGCRLEFDPAYRYAQLPLVNPEHDAVIATYQDYEQGRYQRRRHSLAIEFQPTQLLAAAGFRAIDAAMRAADFADKIAWEVIEARQDKLHATIAVVASAKQVASLLQQAADWFAQMGPIRFRLAGPLIGEKNTGRIYFPLYPEKRDGNPLQELQKALGLAVTDIYLLGYYNFRDELTTVQTGALADILAHYRYNTIFESSVTGLIGFETRDDLVLSGQVIGRSDLLHQIA